MSIPVAIAITAAVLLAGIIIGTIFGPDIKDRWWTFYDWARSLPLRAHARLVPDYGSHSSVPGPVVAGELVIPLPPGQVTAHADAMRELTAPYLPPQPQDPYGWMAAQQEDGPVFRTLSSYMQAGRPVEIPETPDRPPWMITTAALDAVPATDEGTRDMYHGRHSRRQPAFGVDRCEADVLAAEAEAGAQPVMLP